MSRIRVILCLKPFRGPVTQELNAKLFSTAYRSFLGGQPALPALKAFLRSLPFHPCKWPEPPALWKNSLLLECIELFLSATCALLGMLCQPHIPFLYMLNSYSFFKIHLFGGTFPTPPGRESRSLLCVPVEPVYTLIGALGTFWSCKFRPNLHLIQIWGFWELDQASLWFLFSYFLPHSKKILQHLECSRNSVYARMTGAVETLQKAGYGETDFSHFTSVSYFGPFFHFTAPTASKPEIEMKFKKGT